MFWNKKKEDQKPNPQVEEVSNLEAYPSQQEIVDIYLDQNPNKKAVFDNLISTLSSIRDQIQKNLDSITLDNIRERRINNEQLQKDAELVEEQIASFKRNIWWESLRRKEK